MSEEQTQLQAPSPVGFALEVTPKQEKAGESGVASAIGKVILAIVIIGAGIIALPFAFCLIGMLVMSIAGTAIGIAAGIAGVILVFWIVGKAISSLFSKK